MDLLEIAMIGIAVMVAVNVIAPKIGIASPLLLVLLGIGISFLPVVAPIEIKPEWILGGILPPLLYSSAVNMPAMDFRRDLRTISAFSVLLVIGSAVVIGYVMSRLIPDIDLATGIALGAIISPTDAVATSIVKRAGVAPRLVTVLEGESLLNDASALVLLRSATAATALLTGSIAADFVWAVVVAVVVGLVIEVHNAHDSVWTAIRLGLLAALLVIIGRAAFVTPSLWLLARRARRGTAIRDRIASVQDRLQDGSLAPRAGRRGRSDVELAQQRVDRTVRISTSLTRRLADIDYLATQAFGWREGVVLVWAGMRGAVTLEWARRVITTITVDPEEREAEGEDLRSERGELRLAVIELQRAKLLEIRDLGTCPSAVLEDMLTQLDADQLSLELRSTS